MMNFLLANVFLMFKERLVKQAINIRCKTETLLKELFDRFDQNNKGYLSYFEGKEFFEALLNLDLKRKKHYMSLARLLDEMEVTDFDRFERNHVVDFFMNKDGYSTFAKIFSEKQYNLLKFVCESEAMGRT